MGEVKFKADEASLAVIAPSDDFGGTKIQAGFPAIGSQFRLIPDAGDTGHGFEQGSGLVDQRLQPFRTTGPFPAITFVIFQLLEQVMNQQMRVRQGETPADRVVIR